MTHLLRRESTRARASPSLIDAAQYWSSGYARTNRAGRRPQTPRPPARARSRRRRARLRFARQGRGRTAGSETHRSASRAPGVVERRPQRASCGPRDILHQPRGRGNDTPAPRHSGADRLGTDVGGARHGAQQNVTGQLKRSHRDDLDAVDRAQEYTRNQARIDAAEGPVPIHCPSHARARLLQTSANTSLSPCHCQPQFPQCVLLRGCNRLVTKSSRKYRHDLELELLRLGWLVSRYRIVTSP